MIRIALAVIFLISWLGMGWAQQSSTPQKNDPPLELKKKSSADQGKNKLPELKLLDPSAQGKPKADGDQKQKKVPELKPLEPGDLKEKKDRKLKLPEKKGEENSSKAEDPKKVMARIAQNMESADTLLKKEDTGKNTRDIQSKILEDLDKLIHQQQQQEENQKKKQQQERDQKKKESECKNPGESQNPKSKNQTGEKKNGPGSASMPGIGQGQQGSKAQPQKQPGNKKSGNKPKELDNEKKGKPKEEPKLTKEEKGKTGIDQKASDKDNKDISMAKKNTIAELYRDVWGHLPEKARMEMDAYSRSQFMPQYDQILRQYYRTIAEQGRRREKE